MKKHLCLGLGTRVVGPKPFFWILKFLSVKAEKKSLVGSEFSFPNHCSRAASALAGTYVCGMAVIQPEELFFPGLLLLVKSEAFHLECCIDVLARC